MPVLRWLAHVLQASVWFAVNLAICAGLFLLSAHLAAGRGPDDENGAYFFRLIGSVWLFVALWKFVVRGLLRRPPTVPDRSKKTPTGPEVARGMAGCVVRLAVIAAIWGAVGNLASWALAGMTGSDPAHPARRLVNEVAAFGARVEANPDTYIPRIIGSIVAVTFVLILLHVVNSRPAGGSQGRRGTIATSGRKKGRRPDVATANEAAVAQAARAAEARRGVDQAHKDAHRTAPVSPHVGHDFGLRESLREDRVLGGLSYSSSDGAWWARRADGSFHVQLDGPSEGPADEVREVARQVVQRAFEVLLRASEAARPQAQQRGVGLPRFNIDTARVQAGQPPQVTLHLRCDADPGHDYIVRSTDGLHTFRAS